MYDMPTLMARYDGASESDKNTVRAVLADLLSILLDEGGCGVFFADTDGEGEMTVHLLGDVALAPLMIRAAPTIYDRVFGVPEDMTPQ